MLVELDPDILDVGQEDERAERDRGDRLDPAPLAQDGIADRLAGRDVHVVELAGS